MASLRFRGRGQRHRKTLLLIAIGALTGIAVAVALSDNARRMRRRRSVPVDPVADTDLVDAASSDELTDEVKDQLAGNEEDDNEEDDELEDDVSSMSGHILTPGDEELEDRVLEAFHNDPTLRGRAIDIGAIGDGIIELTGWVHSAAEVGYAITLARGVPDVAHVMDSLTIRNPGRTRGRGTSADE